MKPARSSGLLDRTVQQRDARLFVIAVEGEGSGEEFRYFSELERLRLVDRKRLKLLLLTADPERHHSAPAHVLERLDEHCQRHKMRQQYDQHWLVLDVDSWSERTLADVTQKGIQRGYRLAISNPCFELWLLLHETDELGFLARYGPTKRSNATKRRVGELRTQGALALSRDTIWLARARAFALDPGTGERWPAATGTHMFRLIDALADAGALKRV